MGGGDFNICNIKSNLKAEQLLHGCSCLPLELAARRERQAEGLSGGLGDAELRVPARACPPAISVPFELRLTAAVKLCPF